MRSITMEHSCAVSQGILNVFAIFLVDKRKLLVPNFNGATVERRLNTGMTDSGEDPLFEKNVDLLYMGGMREDRVHPLDVAEDVAAFSRDVCVAAGDVREGLEDRKGCP